jgi:hypothetical protein
MREDTRPGIMSMPQRLLRSQIQKVFPGKDETEREVMPQAMPRLREEDPLAVLQQEPFESGEGAARLRSKTKGIEVPPNFGDSALNCRRAFAGIRAHGPARSRRLEWHQNIPDLVC